MTKLTKVIAVRLSEEEYQQHLNVANETGYSKSELFRDYMLKNKLQVVNRDDALNRIFQLKQIGININQLAHRINTDALKGILNENLYKYISRQLDNIYRDVKLICLSENDNDN